jgi:hypothetical protein
MPIIFRYATSRFDNFITRSQVGHSLGEFYGYQTDGFWNSQAQIDAADASAQKVTMILMLFTNQILK